MEGLPSESADVSHEPGLGQDQANVSVDAQARWADKGADSSSGLGYLVPELWSLKQMKWDREKTGCRE